MRVCGRYTVCVSRIITSESQPQCDVLLSHPHSRKASLLLQITSFMAHLNVRSLVSLLLCHRQLTRTDSWLK